MEVCVMKVIVVKYGEGMSDSTVLHKCANVLDCLSKKYNAEIRVRDFKIDHELHSVSIEVEAVERAMSYDEMKMDMDRIFNQMFGDVITK